MDIDLDCTSRHTEYIPVINLEFRLRFILSHFMKFNQLMYFLQHKSQ